MESMEHQEVAVGDGEPTTSSFGDAANHEVVGEVSSSVSDVSNHKIRAELESGDVTGGSSEVNDVENLISSDQNNEDSNMDMQNINEDELLGDDTSNLSEPGAANAQKDGCDNGSEKMSVDQSSDDKSEEIPTKITESESTETGCQDEVEVAPKETSVDIHAEQDGSQATENAEQNRVETQDVEASNEQDLLDRSKDNDSSDRLANDDSVMSIEGDGEVPPSGDVTNGEATKPTSEKNPIIHAVDEATSPTGDENLVQQTVRSDVDNVETADQENSNPFESAIPISGECEESIEQNRSVSVIQEDTDSMPAHESEKRGDGALEASEHVEFSVHEEFQDKSAKDEDDDNLLGSLSQHNKTEQDSVGPVDEGEDPLMNEGSSTTDAEKKKGQSNAGDSTIEVENDGSQSKESAKANLDEDIEMSEPAREDEGKEKENSNSSKADSLEAISSTSPKKSASASDGSVNDGVHLATAEETTNSHSGSKDTVEPMEISAHDTIAETRDQGSGTDIVPQASVGNDHLPTEPSIVIEQVHSEADGEPSEDVEITGEIRPVGRISVVQGLFKPKSEADGDDVTAEEVAALSPKKTVRGKRTLVIIHCGKIVEGLDELKVASCAECKMTKDVLYEVSDGSGEFPICSQACFLEYERTSAICRILKVNFHSIDKEPLPDLSSDWSGIHHYANKCSHCHTDITPNMNSLSWETMEFCSVRCIDDYQKVLGLNCVYCKSTVRASYLGKYCVRFGRELKQFCCNECLERYKPSVKICAYCQRDITKIVGSSCLAQVGETGNFKDFCSVVCIVKYDDLLNLENLGIADCTVCNKNSQVRAKIDFDDKTFVLCSDPCISAFKFVNQIKAENCDTCSKLVDKEKDKPFSITHYSGSKKVRLFCSQGCLNRFVTHSRQIVSCSWCRVKKYNFDLIRVEDAVGRLFFCSVVCLNQHATVKLRRTLCSVCPNQADPRYQMNTATGVEPLCSSPACREKWKERFGMSPIITAVSSLRVAPTQTLQPEPAPVAPPPPSGPIITLPPLVPQPPPIPAKVPVEVTQRVIFRQTLPPLMANKSTGCKPKMLSKGQYFSSPAADVETQTDIPEKVVYVPVPVPIYVPAPMMMYSAPFPVPLPMPMPVPVPIFLPVPKRTHEEVAQFMQKIIEEIPNNPIEADLLAMAAMIADEAEKEEKEKEADSDKPVVNGTDSSDHSLLNGKSALDTDLLEMLASADIDPSDLVNTSLDATEVDFDSTVSQDDDAHATKKGKKRGRSSTSSSKSKKKKKDKEVEEEETQKQSSSLKLEYGLNAWRKWVMQKNNELERIISTGKKGLKLFKTDLLKMTPEEVCSSLCFFVKEITKPDGVRYAPDSIYYLCLGIQQYLYENGRVDNIFADFYYERFSVHLDEVISEYVSARGDEAYLTSRIEEEHLWECRQLGAHSPQVLLYTLMYFNTKYFGLKTVEEHHTLSFVSVVKSWRRVQSGSLEGSKGSQITRLVTLKHLIPSKKKGEKPVAREMLENWENPLRCPVKLYEFYISKCPESARNRSDLYYICPERSCVPDSPVWYSTRQVTDEVLQRMINRTLLVRDVNESLMSIEDES